MMHALWLVRTTDLSCAFFKKLHATLVLLYASDTDTWPCNVQVGGFLQRIDYVRKHAFAVLSILKDDKGQFPIRCRPI